MFPKLEGEITVGE